MLEINHLRTDVQADGPDATQIQPSDWLAGHVITGLGRADVSLAQSDLTGLEATPFEIVAAPGANKLLVPKVVVARFTYGSASFTSADSDPTIGYGTAGWNPFNVNIKVVGLVDDDLSIYDGSWNTPFGNPPGEMLNKSLVLVAVGALSGGTGCSLRLICDYAVYDLA